MYFSVLLGMQLIRPSTLDIACISKWLSYPRRLWNTTGMVVVFGLSRSLRLQALWAAPRYLPVMWQWSFTESPSRGFSHTWHLLAVLWLSQSALVILMALRFRQHFLDPTLFRLESSEEVFCCAALLVFGRRLCLPIAPHHYVAVTACLVVLCPLGVAFCRVELRTFDFRSEGFEVGVDNVRRGQLFVVVLKGELALLGHLHPYGCLANSLALRPVSFQQIFPEITMETALAEVLLLPVFALVVEESVEVFDPGVVKFAGLLNQQQINPDLLFWLLAESVHDHSLVPAEHVYGKVVLVLHLADLRYWYGGIDAGEV